MRLIFCISVLGLLVSCKKDPPAPLPIANFFVDNAGCPSDCYVKFYDQSYSAVKWNWDFDNQDKSELQHDSTYYLDPGFYDVTLTVWNADDVTDEITKEIIIY